MSRLFAYNTGTTISGTYQYNDIAVQSGNIDFSNNVKWYMGPNEDLGYVICSSYLSTRPRFSRSKFKTDASYIDLLSRKYNILFSNAQSGATWLNDNAYWTSYSGSSAKTYLIDFGVSTAGYVTSSPTGGTYWNNFASGTSTSGYSYITSGVTLSNLIDTNSESSTLSIVLTSTNWVSSFLGSANYTLTGVSMGGYFYPAAASRDAFTVLSPYTGTTNITGCDNAKTYNIGIFSSHYPDPSNTFIVQGVSQSINPSGSGFPGNMTMLVWNNVSPSSGVITISAYQPTSTKNAWMNVLEIKQN